jgi:hypothetical protein
LSSARVFAAVAELGDGPVAHCTCDERPVMMKPRTLRFLLADLVLMALLFIVGCLYMSRSEPYGSRHGPESETAQVMAAHALLQSKIEDYRKSLGTYPDTLEIFDFTSSPREAKLQPLVRATAYHHSGQSYSLSSQLQSGGAITVTHSNSTSASVSISR